MDRMCRKLGAVLTTAVLLATVAGCGVLQRPAPELAPPPPPPRTDPVPDPPPPAPDPEPDTGLIDRIAELELRLLEKDARILQLERRLKERERMLDETVQEVLRNKAKLQSRESRAEAASAMAEAEIAIRALRLEYGEAESPELERAEARLGASTREFEAGNFGGALYAAGQVQGLVREARARIHAHRRLDPVDGEEVFAAPVPMTVSTRSNLRAGPGMEFDVLRTLDGGTAVTAYSFKGVWVRVGVTDGTTGWIYKPLLEGRR